MLDVPTAVAFEQPQAVQGHHGLQQLMGLAVRGVEQVGGALVGDPVDERASGQQRVVLHGVEDREGVQPLVGALAQSGQHGGQEVLLAPGEQPELHVVVAQVLGGVPARQHPGEALQDLAHTGALEHLLAGLLGDHPHRVEQVHRLELAAEADQQVLGDELEQDGVVALEGREDVAVGLERGQPVGREVAGSSTGLAGLLHRLGRVPGRDRLEPSGARLELAPLVLVGRAGQDACQVGDQARLRRVQDVRGRDQRKQAVLVGGVVEEQHLLLASRSGELPAGQPVLHCDGERDLADGHAGPRDADPPLDERAEHGEEAAGGRLDGAGVGPVGGDLGETVEQVAPRHPHLVEHQQPVVDAVQPHLQAVADRRDTGQQRTGGVAQRHDDRVYAALLALGGELAEDHRRPPVPSRVADPVLGGRRVGGVHDDLVGLRIMHRGRPHPGHVAAVRDLAHREAAGQAEVQGRSQELLVLPLGTQLQQSAGEQAVLHTHLDQQRQVTHRQTLEAGDERGDVVRAAEALREAGDHQGVPDEGGHLRADPVALLVRRQTQVEREGRLGQPLAHLAPDHGVRALKGLLQRVHVVTHPAAPCSAMQSRRQPVRSSGRTARPGLVTSSPVVITIV